MRAMTTDRYGTPDVLQMSEIPRPEPGSGDVLVEVRAVSLNMYDWHMLTGYPLLARLAAGLRAPKDPVPGADLAGTVVATGEGVTGLSEGNRVFGFVGHGGLAEYASVPETKLVAIPNGITFEQAAATPLAGITALEGLQRGGLRRGQRVLVNGASGGVGTFAVQIAQAMGAEVTAVCSNPKVDLVASLGADRVIDYTRADFVATERDYDVLFDNVGDRPWSQTRRVLAPSGTVVQVTGPKYRVAGPVRELILRKALSSLDRRRFTWFTAAMRREHLEQLAEMLASGQVKPAIEEVYPLEKAAEALRYLGEGHAAGKLVVTV